MPKVIEWLNDPVTGQPQQWPSDAGNWGASSIMIAESGAAVSIARREIYHMGGGHEDGAHSGVYALKYVLPGDPPAAGDWKWRRAIRHPQLFEGKPNYPPNVQGVGTTRNPDRSPVSRHTWGGITYIPDMDRLWIGQGSMWPTGWPDPEHLSWLGDVEAGKWQESFPLTEAVDLQSTWVSCYSPTLKKVFWTFRDTILMHDPVSGEDRIVNGIESIPSQAHGVIDDANQVLYLFYWDPVTVLKFDLTQIVGDEIPRASRPTCTVLTPSGEMTALATYRPGHAWSRTHGHVMWVGGNDLYVAALPNATYTKIMLTGDVAPEKPTQGMFGKFSFLDAAGTIGIINTLVGNDAYVFKTPGA